MEDVRFTIFTGLYNSEKLISRVLDAAFRQDYTNFEWIFIDDCSQDNTGQLIQQFIKDHPELDTKYFRNEENKGVSYGRRKALQMATGDLFVSWDHDDTPKDRQLNILAKTWKEFGNDNIGCIWSLCEDENGDLIGNQFPMPAMVSNYFDMYSEYIINGKGRAGRKERFVCSRVSIYLEIIDYYAQHAILPPDTYPNGDDVWGMMALKYDTIFLNEILRIYYIELDRPSLSSVDRKGQSKRIYNSKKIWINHYLKRLPAHDWMIKLRLHLAIVLYGMLDNRSLKTIQKDVKHPVSKVLVYLLSPFARVLKKYLLGLK